MAGVGDKALLSLGPWPLGINNTAAENRLPRDENGVTRALREADNVDLDTAGVPRRRRGRDRFYDGVLTHSLWSDNNCPFGLFVDDGELLSIDASGGVTPLGMAVGASPVSHALIGERVYFSNRTVSGMVDVDLQVWPWAPEQPAGQPDLIATAGYGLHAGQYQVAVTFTDALGRESGSTTAAVIEIPADHGITLTSIPQPQDAIAVNVYLTDANDQVLRVHSTIAAGVQTLLLASPAMGRALGTQFLTTLPAGQVVRSFNGRHVVADGQYLRWSPPLRYGMTDRSSMVIRFNAHIDLVEPAGGGGKSGGLFVAAGSRTYWLGGPDPETWEPRIRRSCGAVPGSTRFPGGALGLEDGEDVVAWIGRDGQFLVGLEGGVIAAPKQGAAVVNDADRAALLFRSEDGLQQLVAAMKAPRQQGLAMCDRAIAHVIHVDPA